MKNELKERVYNNTRNIKTIFRMCAMEDTTI